MIRSRAWGNVYIDGDELLAGALGLAWAPSDEAKGLHTRFERDVEATLGRLAGASSSYAVLAQILDRHPRRVVIKPFPGTGDPGAFAADPGAECNAQDTPIAPRDASPREFVVGNCLAEVSSARPGDAGTGRGSDAVITFTPWFFQGGAECPAGPGAAGDELLLHELCHALNDLSGRSQMCVAAPRGFTNLEELCAIAITNVYSSETGRALRRDHEGYRALDPDLAVSGAYYNAYQTELDLYVAVQPALVRALGELEIEFNPFRFCTVPDDA